MRVVIDMQGAMTPASAHRGVGRYTRGLVTALINAKLPEDEIILALNGKFVDATRKLRDLYEPLIGAENIKVWQQFYDTTSIVASNSNRKLVGEITREAFLNSFNADIIFSTNLQEGQCDSVVTSCKKLSSNALYCTTLHDVTPLMYKDKYLSNHQVYEWYMEKIQGVVDSDIVFTVSEFSRNKINELIGIPLEKIYVTYNAVDSVKKSDSILNMWSGISKKYQLTDKFFLYVGGNDEHKNIKSFIEAFSLLSDKIKAEYKIVLVGKEFISDGRKLDNIIKKNGLEKNVVFLGFVPDAELDCLYTKCTAFVFPSFSEGFGIPPLEAVCHGAVAITSNATSIPEVVGVEEALFDPFDIHDISKKLKKVIEDENFKKDVYNKEKEHSKKFTWEKSAQKVWKIWRDKVNARNGLGNGVDFKETVINWLNENKNIIISDDNLRDIALSISESDYKNVPAKKTVYLDISATVYEDNKTGIQRVARAISYVLYKAEDLPVNIDVIYTTADDMEYYRATSFLEQIDGKVYEDKSPIIFYPGDIMITLDLHPSVARTHVNVIQYLISKGVKVYHLIHDILPVSDGRFHDKIFCEDFRVNWLDSILKSSGAVCVSSAVMDDVIEYINANSSCRYVYKMAWSHHGADIKTSLPSRGLPTDSEYVLNCIGERITFLMVGTVEPRKGHKQILHVMEKLWADDVDCNLVVVGRQGWQMDEFSEMFIENKEYNKRLFWLKGISDEYLNLVYEKSTALIAASEGEGFGLPLIEAAMNKIPILARDIKVFREVAGEYAYYFSGSDEDIKASLKEWIELLKNNKHPKSIGMPYLTWEQSARNLLDILLKEKWHCIIKARDI